MDFTHSHPSFIIVFHGRIGSIFHRHTIIGGRVGVLHGFETGLWTEMRCLCVGDVKIASLCLYSVGIMLVSTQGAKQSKFPVARC